MMLSCAFTGVIRFFRSKSSIIQCTYMQNELNVTYIKILISHLTLIISNLLAEKAIPKTVSPDYQNYYLKKTF